MLHDAHPGMVHMKGLAKSGGRAWTETLRRLSGHVKPVRGHVMHHLRRKCTIGTVINTLGLLFATHGLPDVIVSDNGASFTSAEFQEFAERNGIRHVTTAPYHPSSNGQAERMVQTTKEALKGEWQTRLARFLLSQHVTPNSSTGKSPAEFLMNRRLTTALDRLHPDHDGDMLRRQELKE
ncbi:gag-pol fusion protein [Pimephales promelas]|nr:gag-pol fusion protein [Pimephales promelas]